MRTLPRAVSSRRSVMPVIFFVVHQVGDLDHQAFFVQGVRDFGDDDLVAALVAFDDFGDTAGDDAAAAGGVGRADRFFAINDAAGWEIRAFDVLQQVVEGGIRVVDHGRLSASTSSLRLCGGMLVAIPTAIPSWPFSSKLGSLAGRTVGSCVVPS